MMMKYPKEYLDEIRLRVKVSQVVGKYVQLKKEVKNLLDYHHLKMKNSVFYSERRKRILPLF